MFWIIWRLVNMSLITDFCIKESSVLYYGNDTPRDVSYWIGNLLLCRVINMYRTPELCSTPGICLIGILHLWCLYPHSTRRRSMAICAIWKSATDCIGLGWFGCTSDTITTNKRSDGALAAIYETWWRPTDRQSTFCKAAIEPDQIMLCWRSNATRKRSDGDAWDIRRSVPGLIAL